MNIEEELKKITENIGTKELITKILSAYLEEMKSKEFIDSEQEYQQSKQILNFVLTNGEKENLIKMERLFRENMQYSMGFGFKRGIYAGYEQFFSLENTKDSFGKFVYDELLVMPNMKKYTTYYNRQTEINMLFDKVMRVLETDNQEHMTTIYCACDEKNYAVLREAFYMGYRYALSMIEEIKTSNIADITDKILYTEHELGFTMTCKERERWKGVYCKNMRGKFTEKGESNNEKTCL